MASNTELTSSDAACKGKEADLYSAFIEVPYTQGAQPGTDHTVLPANYTVPASTS